MPSYTPTFTITTPGLTITMAGNITYDQFIGTLGADVHLVNSLYLIASSYDQIFQVIDYTIFDATGHLFSFNLPVVLDFYQKLPAAKLDKPPYGMVLNGQSSFSFNMMPNSQLLMQLNTDQLSFTDRLDRLSKSNFGKVDVSTDILELYQSQQKPA